MSTARGGQPLTYTAELAEQICRRLVEGESLREMCRDPAMPLESTVRGWVVDDRDGFAARYGRAREAQMDRWADEIIEIADEDDGDWMDRQQGGETVRVVDHEHVHRSRLRVDARKWLMAKLAPRRYGDKLELDHSGNLIIQQVSYAAVQHVEQLETQVFDAEPEQVTVVTVKP